MDLLYKANKTAEDIDTLLSEHQRLVYYMLKRMKQRGNPDAESVAWEALWDAINLFDIYSKTEFSTYACTLIQNAVNNVLRKQTKQYAAQQELVHQLRYMLHIDSKSEVYMLHRIGFLLDKYLKDKSVITKQVLSAWYESEFEYSVTELSRTCGCAASYVSRIQQLFRAYLVDNLE